MEKKAGRGDDQRGTGEQKCQKANAVGMKKKIGELVRGHRNVDEYFKRQTKGNDTL